MERLRIGEYSGVSFLLGIGCRSDVEGDFPAFGAADAFTGSESCILDIHSGEFLMVLATSFISAAVDGHGCDSACWVFLAIWLTFDSILQRAPRASTARVNHKKKLRSMVILVLFFIVVSCGHMGCHMRVEACDGRGFLIHHQTGFADRSAPL